MAALAELERAVRPTDRRREVTFDYVHTSRRGDEEGARLFALGDGHNGAPYANAPRYEKIKDEGLRGYRDNGRWVDHPAAVFLDMGDNRDIIDHKDKFRLPQTLYAHHRIIDAHIADLDRDIAAYPDCRFVVMKDNHACVPGYDSALSQLQKKWRDRLEIHTFYTRVADALVWHSHYAIRPHECRVDEARADVFDGKDLARYGESYKTLSQSRIYQVGHDIISKYLTPQIVERIYRPDQCVPKIVNWFLARDPAALDGVNHIVSADSHRRYVGYRYEIPGVMDRETGKPKVIYLHNTGVNVGDGLNPLNVFLDTPDVTAHSRIMKIVSFTQPQTLRWALEESDLARKPVAARAAT